jgi:hypothetical protein
VEAAEIRDGTLESVKEDAVVRAEPRSLLHGGGAIVRREGRQGLAHERIDRRW